MLLFCFVGFIAACLTIFLNYCIGKPGSEKFSPYEIFSSYTVWLSMRRLRDLDLLQTYQQQYEESVKNINHIHEVISIKNDFKKMLYDAADPFFTWERALGMCQICTGFWISLITGIFFTHNFFNLVIIIVISHVTIRILSKII